MLIATCDCGYQMTVHKAYLPKDGRYDIWLCPQCKKEWEIFKGRSGYSINEVRKAKKRELQVGPMAKRSRNDLS